MNSFAVQMYQTKINSFSSLTDLLSETINYWIIIFWVFISPFFSNETI